MQDFYIGLILAISSSIFIGCSFIIKKKALLKSAVSNRSAGHGGHSYLREWLWWVGITMMATGEACNFAAYAFAPASLVTSLGALSVLVTVVLSSYILNEKLGFLGKIGCALCVLGATMIVLHAPKDGNVVSMSELADKMQDLGFLIYVALVVSSSLILIFHVAPKYGRTNIFVFIAICSIVGSMTVLGCKGLGLALKEHLVGDEAGNSFGVDLARLLKDPMAWLWVLVVAFCITVQLNYLNKALDVYNISMVTSILYVGFTSCVIIASGILYKEWSALSAKDVLGSICGFLTTVIGVFQMQSFNDLDISMSQLRKLIYKPAESTQQSFTYANGNTYGKWHKRRRSMTELSQSEPLLSSYSMKDSMALNSFENNGKSRLDDCATVVHCDKVICDNEAFRANSI